MGRILTGAAFFCLRRVVQHRLRVVIPVAISHDTIAHSLRVIEAILSGLSLKSFHAAQQASTISSWFWKTR
ncbi:MAG: hypothetical protein QF384_22755, partial [Alphaproteobacteria bacterium]|nr:hypothetical protein [Alphaproteobacteria bacterium]